MRAPPQAAGLTLVPVPLLRRQHPRSCDRFLLEPPSLWPGVSAGGWCVKVMKSTTKPDVTTVKFNDSTVTFSFAVVASWKPVS